MPYVGSYIWRVRQKVGHDLLVMPGVEVVAVRDGKLLMVYNKDFQEWCFPGGAVENNLTWTECAARELEEEGGLIVDPKDLKPFAIGSGKDFSLIYPNGDKVEMFVNYFVVDKFKSETDILDTAEVSKTKWFSLDEIEKLQQAPQSRVGFLVYKEYLKSGQFQVIEAAT